MELPGYTGLARLHQGGQAVVYRARRASDGAPVVLKVLEGPWPSADQTARFHEEHRLTRAMEGPGVVPVVDLATAGALSVLVLVDGGGESLERLYTSDRPDRETFLSIARQLVDAVRRVHTAGVLHLDVNPANVVYAPHTGRLELIDFGLAVDRTRVSAELAAEVARGTVAFAAPEQTGPMNRSVDHRADLYALGATLYWLLTGRPPFVSDDPMELIHAHVARRPRPPAEVDPSVPRALSDVVLKLLEKNPEDRYQSAGGLRADLDRVDAGEAFEPGADDPPARFTVPERLYGREAALDALARAFQRVRDGAREVLFVEGAAGVGKTTLVREARRALAHGQASVVSGKFDPFEQERPYQGLGRALGGFVRRILAGRPEDVEGWRARIGAALGSSGALLVEPIPELTVLLGPQPPVPELPPLEAEARLHRTARRFVEVLGSRGSPLVLFLDDLQWADASTLALLRALLVTPGGGPALFIGAYRHDEVGPRLRGFLRDLEASVPSSTLSVEPMDDTHVQALLSDALRRPPEDLRELAAVCRERTAGNPFFVRSFLESVARRGLLRFDDGAHRWTWDLDPIAALDVTDNVVGFLRARLADLPPGVLATLEASAVIGDPFALVDVQELVDDPSSAAPALRRALSVGLIDEVPPGPRGRRFRFAHDRVREAVVEGLPAGRLRALHRARADRLLAALQESDGDALYALVEHLQAAGPHPDPPSLARLELRAGERALAASAHVPAARWLEAARGNLGPDAWARDPDATRRATVASARAAWLTGDPARMDARVDEAVAHARDVVDRIDALRVRIDGRIAANRTADAVREGLDALATLGIHLPGEPTDADIGAALGALGALLQGAPVQDLPTRAPPADPVVRAGMALTCALAPPAYFCNQALLPLLAAELVRATVEHGPTADSAYGFALLGLVLCSVGDIPRGEALGALALDLAERFDDPRAAVRASHVVHGFVAHWTRTARDLLPDYRALFERAVDLGDFEYAGYSGMMVTIYGLYTSDDLTALGAEARRYRQVMEETGQQPSLAIQGMLDQALRNLRGEASDPLVLTGAAYDEAVMRAVFAELGDPTAWFVLHCVKGVVAGLYGAWEEARDCLEVAQAHLHGAAATIHLVALAQWRGIAALRADPGAPEAIAVAREARATLAGWAAHVPGAHDHRVQLLDALLHDAEGRPFEALKALESAAETAAATGHPGDRAVALRLAGEIASAHGLPVAARASLTEARHTFERWGAPGVAQALEHTFPGLLGHLPRGGEGPRSSLGSTSGIGDLEVEAVVRVSRAIARETGLDRLVETLVRVSMEASGAQRCVVVSPFEGDLAITALGTSEPEPRVSLGTEPLGSEHLAEGVVRYVARTRETVLLGDATQSELFGADPYVQAQRPRSVLCVPIAQQGRLSAVLYLEHRGIPELFIDRRLALLKVILGQAAIAVENALLIDTLEAKVRERTQALAAATEVAEAANRAKTVFLRSMSHELRTPLNAILGFSQLLLGGDVDGEARRDAARTIRESGRHLLALVDDLLDMGRIEAGRLELSIEPVELGPLTESVAELLRPAIHDKGLGFRVAFDQLPARVDTDARRVRQILLNLLGNAVKFTERGEVGIRARHADGVLRFEVHDTGPGIPAGQLAAIFEPFEQVGSARERAMGTGLGLAIARQLARQLGGDLTVVSQVGVGSTFVLELPGGRGSKTPAPVERLARPTSGRPVQAPPGVDLGALRALGAQGAMLDLARAAEALAAENPAYVPFFQALARAARDFDDDTVGRLLAAPQG